MEETNGYTENLKEPYSTYNLTLKYKNGNQMGLKYIKDGSIC